MADGPEYLTVPEVMARLRLGRTTVYEQARRYLATDGAEGLPCRRFGRVLRFPAAALDLNVARPAEPMIEAEPEQSHASEPPAPAPVARVRPRRNGGDAQASLPFTA